MKRCIGCEQELPLDSYYGGQGPNRDAISSRCRKCHNRQCVERKRANPEYRAKQYAAKARWQKANPDRKRVHEGRAVVLANPQAPTALRELETTIYRFYQAITEKRKAA